MPERKNLVIVRAGGRSLHPGWLALPYEQRSFDLVVSYYDEGAFSRHVPQKGVRAFLKKGGKWDGLFHTLEWLRDELAAYDYFWLPDDDIETDAPTINRLFDLMRWHDLSVGQPSLTPDSYFTHFLFIHCPQTVLRRTNFIEIMVPCLARDVLLTVKRHFRGSMSGFGLDYIWCRMPEAGIGRAGILDEIMVRHTRPVGRVLAESMEQLGVSPRNEEEDLKTLFGITDRVTPLVHSMVTNKGRLINGPQRTAARMAVNHLKYMILNSPYQRRYGLGRIIQLVRRQLTRECDLSPISWRQRRRRSDHQLRVGPV